MKQITLDLDEKQQRPIAILDNGLNALIDTGAYLPVWLDQESILVNDLGAQMIKKNVPFTGFGGTTQGDLYQVTLQVGELIYPNMSIVANSELNAPFNMILSATMFQHMIYEIDDYRHKFNITVPDGESMVRNLRVIDRNGSLHVLCHSFDMRTKI